MATSGCALSLIAQYFDQPNSGYYGLGNGSGVDRAALADDRRYHQYAVHGVMAQPFARIRLSQHLHGWVKGEVSYRAPSLHPDSKLARDVREAQLDSERGRLLKGLLHGLKPHFLTVAQTGVFWDTRDHEFAPPERHVP